jgi:hypothetical protein
MMREGATRRHCVDVRWDRRFRLSRQAEGLSKASLEGAPHQRPRRAQ